MTVAANIRAFAQFIEDTLVTTGGWVYVPQTGDTAPSALTAATATNQKKGFRVYRMNDALQATKPCFMRLDWGGGSASGVISPGVWVTVGQGVDGAGNITNKLFDGGSGSTCTWGPTGVSSTSQASNCYASADVGRACFAMFITASNTNYNATWGIERAKDASGADTGDLLMVWRNADQVTSSVGLGRSAYLINAAGAQPTVETGLCYIISINTPTQAFGAGDVGVGVILPIKGIAQQPGTNFLVCGVNDIANESALPVTIYGVAHNYQHLNTIYIQRTMAGGSINDANMRILMRFD